MSPIEETEIQPPRFHSVTIVANRHKWSGNDAGRASATSIDALLDTLIAKYSTGLYVVGLNNDMGFGKVVERACIFKDVRFIHYSCRFPGDVQGQQPVHLFFQQAKNEALFAACHEFHVFTNRTTRPMLPGQQLLSRIASPIEDVVLRLQTEKKKLYTLYNNDNQAFEIYPPEATTEE